MLQVTDWIEEMINKPLTESFNSPRQRMCRPVKIRNGFEVVNEGRIGT